MTLDERIAIAKQSLNVMKKNQEKINELSLLIDASTKTIKFLILKGGSNGTE